MNQTEKEFLENLLGEYEVLDEYKESMVLDSIKALIEQRLAQTPTYNEKISQEWEMAATKNATQLFFALAANAKGSVFMFWDNKRGNEMIIKYLEDIVKMLKNKPDANYSQNNGKVQ